MNLTITDKVCVFITDIVFHKDAYNDLPEIKQLINSTAYVVYTYALDIPLVVTTADELLEVIQALKEEVKPDIEQDLSADQYLGHEDAFGSIKSFNIYFEVINDDDDYGDDYDDDYGDDYDDD